MAAMVGTSLKARAEDKDDPNVRKMTIYKVNPLILVEEEDFNLRDYDDPEVVEQIESFCESFAKKKYVPPLLVWTNPNSGKQSPVEGHLRRRGALLAIERGFEVPEVECVPFTGTEEERISVMLRSAEGLKLRPWKIAIGYLRLHKLGKSNAEIASLHRKTPQHVEQMLLLAQAPAEVYELVRSEKVDAQAAVEAIRKYKEKAAEFLQGKVVEVEGLGKKKVTRGTLKEWTPPAKVVTSVIGSVKTVMSSLDTKTRTMLAKYETMDPEVRKAELSGKKIEIDMDAFVELIRANGAVSEAEAAKEAKDAAAKSAASQQSIEMSGEDQAVEAEQAAAPADAPAPAPAGTPTPYSGDGEDDPLLQTAVELVVREKRASVSLVQRHLRVGYNRAANLIAAMEAAGVVGAAGAGSNERKVLRTKV